MSLRLDDNKMSINAKFLFLSFRSIEIREESEVISRVFDWLQTRIVLTGETRKRSHETRRLRLKMRRILFDNIARSNRRWNQFRDEHSRRFRAGISYAQCCGSKQKTVLETRLL